MDNFCLVRRLSKHRLMPFGRCYNQGRLRIYVKPGFQNKKQSNLVQLRLGAMGRNGLSQRGPPRAPDDKYLGVTLDSSPENIDCCDERFLIFFVDLRRSAGKRPSVFRVGRRDQISAPLQNVEILVVF